MSEGKTATDGRNVGGDPAPTQLAGMLNVGEQAAPPSKLLLNTRDAAKALSIGLRKLWSLTDCGEILCVHIGRRVLYDPADLQTFIDRQKRVLP